MQSVTKPSFNTYSLNTIFDLEKEKTTLKNCFLLTDQGKLPPIHLMFIFKDAHKKSILREYVVELSSESGAACLALGNMYYSGEGGGFQVYKDDIRAREYYEKGRLLNNPNAVYCLGDIYFEGNGIQKDFFKAFQYFQEAYDLGHPTAARMLGECHYHGYGTPRNDEQANYYFKEATESGVKNIEERINELHYRI